MPKQQVKAVIMAAGKGTRMKSALAKVMHEVFFAPMLHHVLASLAPLGLLSETVVVTGHQAEEVEASLATFPVYFARQQEQLGTAHAVLAARDFLQDFAGTVLILCGDTPLIRSETLRAMLDSHHASAAPLTVMTTRLSDPTNYGRIITDTEGRITRIVEEKDASREQKAISEINAGVYCVAGSFLLDGLGRVDDRNRQKEFYLTDLVSIARSLGYQVGRYFCPDGLEVLGVNSRQELAEAHKELQCRRNRQLMAAGVTILSPESVEISPEARIAQDTVIERNVTIAGVCEIGTNCRLGPQVVLRNTRLGDNTTIEPFSFLSDCNIPAAQTVKAGSVRKD